MFANQGSSWMVGHSEVIQFDGLSPCRGMTARSGGGRQKEQSGVHRPSEANTFVNTCDLSRPIRSLGVRLREPSA